MGDSREKALEALSEAVNLWIESCVRRGTLREALGELGFVAVQRLPLTNDVFRIDDECYWRFPNYLPALSWRDWSRPRRRAYLGHCPTSSINRTNTRQRCTHDVVPRPTSRTTASFRADAIVAAVELADT